MTENTYTKQAKQLSPDKVKKNSDEKYAQFTEQALELITRADTAICSLDLDGVIFSDYQENEPIINQGELKTIPKHISRIRQHLASAGKEFYLWINSNRELPTISKLAEILHLETSQNHVAAVLEGGHVLGYQVNKNQIPSEWIQDKTITYPDGGIAHIVNQNESDMLISESLLESPHLRDIRLGKKQLSVAKARETLCQVFDSKLKTLGKNAWIPEGRQGMVTVRGVDPIHVVSDQTEDLTDVKKWQVPEDAPIFQIVKQALQLSEDDKLTNLPFELIYYPFDGGFDIQFKGLDKRFGQKALVVRMKSLGIISPESQVVVGQVGDSGSDAIAFKDIDLKTDCIVIAVANADPGLIEKASFLATYPHRKGVRQTLYGLHVLAKELFLKN